jgi:regulatory protein
MQPLHIGLDKALQKIRHYCAYQERNHLEVKDKLYSFGLYKDEVEAMLMQMIEENYLNEERYAIAFAGGKFRMKNWGKSKIKYELKLRQVSDYCIKKALASIDEEAYQEALDKLLADKLKTLRSKKNIFTKKKKLQSYLLQKGYETSLITERLKII